MKEKQKKKTKKQIQFNKVEGKEKKFYFIKRVGRCW